MTNQRLAQIRQAERASHIQVYTEHKLYEQGSWLQKPIKTVLDILPLFEGYEMLRVLDLGAGVGRNCIPFAQTYQDIPCHIDCVDILELAIGQLEENAKAYQVEPFIHGIVSSIDAYPIEENTYDVIMAISTVVPQQYDIPRSEGMVELTSNVVTYVARKEGT